MEQGGKRSFKLKCDVFGLMPVVNITSGIIYMPFQVQYSYKHLFQSYIFLELLGFGAVNFVTVGNSLKYTPTSVMVLPSITMSSLCYG